MDFFLKTITEIFIIIMVVLGIWLVVEKLEAKHKKIMECSRQCKDDFSSMYVEPFCLCSQPKAQPEKARQDP